MNKKKRYIYKKIENKNPLNRIRFIKYIFYICFISISVRAFLVQNFSNEELVNSTQGIYKSSITIEKKRGTIFDRNGEVLAMSIDAWDIGIRPGLKKKPIDIKEISKITNTSQSFLTKKFNSNSSFTYIKRKASKETIDKIKDHIKESKVPSNLFEFVKTHKRVYPNRSLAAAVIGFSNLANTKTGIEKKYDYHLKGDKVTIPIVSAGKGNWYPEYSKYSSAKPGKDIYLTIDKKIQHITETALKKGVEKYNAKDGKAIVLNPETGEVLAMAQYPFFNPNTYWKHKPKTWYNRNAFDAFEPGSIMKVFLVAGAIESEYCTKNSIFYCKDGSYKIGPVTIHDTKAHKWLQVTDIIKYSSNIGVARIAEVVGKKPFYNILRDFGFGEKSGIDVPVETAGILRRPEQWTRVDTSNIAFGQGISASSIQVVKAAAAIANNGVLINPSLVKNIVQSNGEVTRLTYLKKKKKILSKRTALELKKMMELVVEDGTGKNAKPEGYDVAGKTGTSQKLTKEGTYSRKKYIATFLGFAPSKKPELVVLVAVNEPKDKYYGGDVAAPVFKDIVSKSLHYMNIPPSDMTIALNKEEHGP